jgi:hypothetical protein
MIFLFQSIHVGGTYIGIRMWAWEYIDPIELLYTPFVAICTSTMIVILQS